MAKVPSFGLLGQSAKDLLYGGKDGRYHYDKVLNVTSTTSDGVTFALSALNKDDKVDLGLKATYAAPKYNLLGTISQAGKLGVSASYKELAPGLTLGVSGTVGDAESGKLAADYAVPHLTLKSTVSLVASPKLDLAATTGYDNFTVGGEASFDSAKSAITKWTAGVGYTAADFQAAVLVNDRNVVTGLYAHKVNPTATVGAEIVHDLSGASTTFVTGLSRVLEGGALAKAKLDNKGIVSLLYEQDLRPYNKLVLTTQFDSKDLSAQPRFGVGYDLKY
jgi:voltage-dependent anion channel protein 2